MIRKARTRSRGGSFAAAATSKKGWAACAESPARVPPTCTVERAAGDSA